MDRGSIAVDQGRGESDERTVAVRDGTVDAVDRPVETGQGPSKYSSGRSL